MMNYFDFVHASTNSEPLRDQFKDWNLRWTHNPYDVMNGGELRTVHGRPLEFCMRIPSGLKYGFRNEAGRIVVCKAQKFLSH